MKLRPFLRSFRPLLLLLAAIWAVELLNWALGYRLNDWLGLRPRTAEGLIGVVTMPFLHASMDHALANTIPLAVLGVLGVIIAPRRFYGATVAIVLASGLALWFFARPNTIHVGASGLIFGWAGYLTALGFIERSVRTIIGSVIVIAAYGGMIWGVIPRSGLPISWGAHLFGAAAGVAAAYLQTTRFWPRRWR